MEVRKYEKPAAGSAIYGGVRIPLSLQKKVQAAKVAYCKENGLKNGQSPTLVDFYIHFANEGYAAIQEGAMPIFIERPKNPKTDYRGAVVCYPDDLKEKMREIQAAIAFGSFQSVPLPPFKKPISILCVFVTLIETGINHSIEK